MKKEVAYSFETLVLSDDTTRYQSPTPHHVISKGNVKVIPQQAEVAERVPGRLRSRIFLTFGTTRVVGR